MGYLISQHYNLLTAATYSWIIMFDLKHFLNWTMFFEFLSVVQSIQTWSSHYKLN